MAPKTAELILRVSQSSLCPLLQHLLLLDLSSDELCLGRVAAAQPDELLPQPVQPLLPLPHLHLHGLNVAAALHPLVDLPVAHFLGLDWQHLRVYDLERGVVIDIHHSQLRIISI